MHFDWLLGGQYFLAWPGDLACVASVSMEQRAKNVEERGFRRYACAKNGKIAKIGRRK